MSPQTRNRNLPPPPPWAVSRDKKKIGQDKKVFETERQPTPEERITKIDTRMLSREGKMETLRGKIKGKKVIDDATGEEIYQRLPESALRVYRRNLANEQNRQSADEKLLVKLTGRQAGRMPSSGVSTEKMGPPKPEDDPSLADIDVSGYGEGTVLRDKETGKYYKVVDGKLVSWSVPKGL